MEEILEKQKQKKLQNVEHFSGYFERAKQAGKLNSKASPRDLAVSLTCYLSGVISEYLRNQLLDLKVQAPFLMDQFFASFGDIDS